MAQNERCPKCGWKWVPTERCVYYVCPKCHAIHAEGSSIVEDLGPPAEHAEGSSTVKNLGSWIPAFFARLSSSWRAFLWRVTPWMVRSKLTGSSYDDYAPRSDKDRPAVPVRGFCAKNCEFPGHSKLITSIKFNYDGSCLASLGYDDTIRLWSLSEKKELECFNYKYKGNYKAIGFSPDNKLYAAGISQPNRDDPYRLVVADVNAKKALASLKLGSKGYPFSSNAPESILFNPKCNLVAAIYSCIEVIRPYKGGDIFLWQLNKNLFGYKLKEVANMCGRVSHYRFPVLAFNPDGDTLVTTQPVMVEGSVSGNRWVAIAEFWNVQSGKLVDMIEIPDLLGIKSIHFTVDGNVLLGTELSGLRSFRIWDKKRNRVTKIEHSAEVLSSAISPNGRLLATGDKAGLVRLTSIPEGNEISRIQAGSQNYGVSCVAFSPDGNSIALTADKIEVWGLS